MQVNEQRFKRMLMDREFLLSEIDTEIKLVIYFLKQSIEKQSGTKPAV
jgi:hypothetical protein